MVKLFLTIMAVLIMASPVQAGTDLRPYLPPTTNILKKDDGTPYARYSFTLAPPGFQNLYTTYLNLNKPGTYATWKKEFWKNGAWCTSTYAVLFLGNDLSVTEVGDWYAQTPCTPNILMGYRNVAGQPTGLVWSQPGGLTTEPFVHEMNVWAQASPGQAYQANGYAAYSKAGVIELLQTYQIPNSSTVYTNVVHLVMYHGTKLVANPETVRCPIPPLAAHGAYYQSFKDYNSYAIELWLAEGVGIIQHATTFIESGDYWNLSDCIGEVFDAPFTWTAFLETGGS